MPQTVVYICRVSERGRFILIFINTLKENFMIKTNMYESPELELTEFRSEEGVFQSQIESVEKEDEIDWD